APLSEQRPARAEHVPVLLELRSYVGLYESGLRAAVKRHVDTNLVGVGHVMPHPLVPDRGHVADRSVEQLQHPVEVVRAPVVDRPAGDGLVAVPEIARMRIPADEGLHVEELADATGA